MTLDKPKAIFLMGPTASGKTALAIQLAQQLPVELISVDSTLVYRGMDIGTAKPDADELALAPHHLLDIRDPAEPYSAAEFCEDAERLAADIVARGRIPLFVGGTMLYFKALVDGLADMPAANASVRQEIDELAASKGWPAVHQQLELVDPAAAAAIHPNHSQRISRALEVYRVSGQTMTELKRRQHETPVNGFAQRFDLRQLGIAPRQRAILHRRIEARYQAMLEQGLLAEVERLYSRGDLHDKLPSVRAVGYRQLWEYLAGECELDEAVERAVIATRQLAKRQFTWMRSWSELDWLYIDDESGDMVPKQDLFEQALRFIQKKVI